MRRRKHTFRLIFADLASPRDVLIAKRRWRRMCAGFRAEKVKLYIGPNAFRVGCRICAIDRMIVVAHRGFRRGRG